jgi:hypothetical protein
VVDFRISVADRTTDDGYPSSYDAGYSGPANRPLCGTGFRPIKGIRTIVGNWVRVEHPVTALAAWSGRVAVGCAVGGTVLLFGHVPPPGKVAVGSAGDGRHRFHDAAVKPVAVLAHRARAAGRLRGKQATSVHALQVNRHGTLAVLHGLPDDKLRDVAFWDLRTPKPRRIPSRGLQAGRLVFVRDSADQFVVDDGREISRRATGRPLTPLAVYRGFEGGVSDIAVSRDGSRVAALGGDVLRVWDADGEPLLTAPVAGAGTVRGVGFSDDGAWVLATAPGLGLVAYPVQGPGAAGDCRADPPEPVVIPVTDHSGPYTPSWWALIHPGILWIQRPHGIQVRYLSDPGRRQFSLMERLAADIPPAYDPADGRIAVAAADRHFVKIERLAFL